jgi:hypothetical protein
MVLIYDILLFSQSGELALNQYAQTNSRKVSSGAFTLGDARPMCCSSNFMTSIAKDCSLKQNISHSVYYFCEIVKDNTKAIGMATMVLILSSRNV